MKKFRVLLFCAVLFLTSILCAIPVSGDNSGISIWDDVPRSTAQGYYYTDTGQDEYYITETGTHYHERESCVKKPIPASLERAYLLDPCSKCVHNVIKTRGSGLVGSARLETQSDSSAGIVGSSSPSGTTYYITPTGKKYHLNPSCGGANSSPSSSTHDLDPCKKCAGG